jgi:hypothetical protein
MLDVFWLVVYFVTKLNVSCYIHVLRLNKQTTSIILFVAWYGSLDERSMNKRTIYVYIDPSNLLQGNGARTHTHTFDAKWCYFVMWQSRSIRCSGRQISSWFVCSLEFRGWHSSDCTVAVCQNWLPACLRQFLFRLWLVVCLIHRCNLRAVW